MSKIYKIKLENGYYLFKLEQVLDDKKLSKNKVIRDTNTDFKVLKRLGTGEVVRMDITVLARLCDYLDCSLSDLVKYVSEKK